MTAAARAAELDPEQPVRWRALELAAFADHPTVLHALDPSGGHGRRKPGGGVVVAGIIAIIGFLVAIAPVYAFAMLFEYRFGYSRGDAAERIPMAGIVDAIYAPLLIGAIIWWAVRGRRFERPLLVLAATCTVTGALSAALAAVRGVSEQVPGWQAWSVPMVVVCLAGLVWSLLLLRARGRAAAERGAAPRTAATRTAGEPLQRVRVAVERLDAGEQQKVRADLDAAIATLERRGAIDAADAEQARGAELGKLALRMSGPRPARPRADG